MGVPYPNAIDVKGLKLDSVSVGKWSKSELVASNGNSLAKVTGKYEYSSMENWDPSPCGMSWDKLSPAMESKGKLENEQRLVSARWIMKVQQ